MKKSLSVLLALVMLISAFTPFSAFADGVKNHKDAPRIKIGEKLSFEYTGLGEDADSFDEKPEYFAKFVPQETGYYVFKFNNRMREIDGLISLFIVNSSGDNKNETPWDGTEKLSPRVACKMTKGYAYYFGIDGWDCGTIKNSISVATHTHNYVVDSRASNYVLNAMDMGFDIIEDGEKYKYCELCNDSITLETYYAPKSVTVNNTDIYYNGSAKKPSVTVKDRKGNVIPSSNYKVTYSQNVNVGKATALVTFNNVKYIGEMKTTFVIKPPAIKMNSVSALSKGFVVKWTPNKKQCSGYQVKYSRNKDFSNSTVKTVSGNINSSKTVTGLKANQKYYVRIRTYKVIDGKKYYSPWSGYKTVTTKK